MRISDWSSDVCSSDLETEDGDILAAFLGQFYDDKPAPRLILLSHAVPEAELIAEALSTRAERKVELLVPQRGSKRKLVEQIGRASCRERVCQYVSISGAAVSVTQKQ